MDLATPRPKYDFYLTITSTKIRGTDADNQIVSSEILKYNFKRANKVLVSRTLSDIDWNSILENDESTENDCEIFRKQIIQAIKTSNVPTFKSQTKNQDNNEIKKIIEKRDKVDKILIKNSLRKTDCEMKTIELANLNKEIERNLQKQENEREKQVIARVKENPKEFYKFADRNKTVKAKIGPLKIGNTYETDPKRMANIFADQYKSVFSKPREDISQLNLKNVLCPKLEDLVIQDEDVIQAIKDINPSSAPGPDEIPTIFYKDYAQELVLPIKRIWRKSLDNGEMPEGVAISIIIPIYKEGLKGEPSNYRPVALTNHLTKIFERILRKAIVKHLEANDLMNETQFGFRTGRSTISQLARYYDSIMTMLENGNRVDSIYLDFAKAFDKVDHNILIMKLKSLSIDGNILRWIEKFLKERKQVVRVCNQLSREERVISGVPQGSVLGPILFLVMMHDINENIFYATIGSFADDTRLWKLITANSDIDNLQNDLQIIYEWADNNNMLFNGKKFEGISFGKNDHDNYQKYKTPETSEIDRKHHVKDLGIIVSDDLKFNNHINSIVQRGLRMCGWILRTFKTRDFQTMKILLQSLIISQMEYACLIWSPTDRKMIDLLESVQKRFTSRISIFQRYDITLRMPICDVNYIERLNRLKIYSLERRRERFQILFVYKILSNMVPNPGLTYNYNPRTKVRFEPKFSLKTSAWIRKHRMDSFFVRGPVLYNCLPEKMRILPDTTKSMSQNFEKFKKELDKWLENIPDTPGRRNTIESHL